MEDSISDNHHHEYFMSLALKVAQSALSIGEVPVGCVIVLREFDSIKNDDKELAPGGIVVSHGANQVNATRDATRHAECVAIDRMLTGGLASDQARLPAEVIVRNAHGDIPSDCNLDRAKVYKDHWTDVVSDNPDHSENRYGWGSGRTYKPDIFQKCDLYVTCEPCIMVRTHTYVRIETDIAFFCFFYIIHNLYLLILIKTLFHVIDSTYLSCMTMLYGICNL